MGARACPHRNGSNRTGLGHPTTAEDALYILVLRGISPQRVPRIQYLRASRVSQPLASEWHARIEGQAGRPRVPCSPPPHACRRVVRRKPHASSPLPLPLASVISLQALVARHTHSPKPNNRQTLLESTEPPAAGRLQQSQCFVEESRRSHKRRRHRSAATSSAQHRCRFRPPRSTPAATPGRPRAGHRRDRRRRSQLATHDVGATDVHPAARRRRQKVAAPQRFKTAVRRRGRHADAARRKRTRNSGSFGGPAAASRSRAPRPDRPSQASHAWRIPKAKSGVCSVVKPYSVSDQGGHG